MLFTQHGACLVPWLFLFFDRDVQCRIVVVTRPRTPTTTSNWLVRQLWRVGTTTIAMFFAYPVRQWHCSLSQKTQQKQTNQMMVPTACTTFVTHKYSPPCPSFSFFFLFKKSWPSIERLAGILLGSIPIPETGQCDPCRRLVAMRANQCVDKCRPSMPPLVLNHTC